MHTLDKTEDDISVASQSRPVLMSAVPNVTNAPNRGNLGGDRVYRFFYDDETFKKVTWKGHGTHLEIICMGKSLPGYPAGVLRDFGPKVHLCRGTNMILVFLVKRSLPLYLL